MKLLLSPYSVSTRESRMRNGVQTESIVNHGMALSLRMSPQLNTGVKLNCQLQLVTPQTLTRPGTPPPKLNLPFAPTAPEINYHLICVSKHWPSTPARSDTCK